MNQKVKVQYDRMATAHKRLFDELRNYSDEVLNKKPAPNAWSVMQVVDHLMVADNFSLEYLKRKLPEAKTVKNEGFKGWYKSMLLKVIFLMPIKFKVPPSVVPSDSFITLKDAEAKWTGIRNGLYEITGKLHERELSRGLWKHVRAGKMNIYQMYDFLHIHFERHRKQIEKTLMTVK